jgi:hypothetical protein
LPQKYKDAIKSVAAQQNNSAESSSAKKIEKALTVFAELAKAVEKTPCAEEKRTEITQNLKTCENQLKQLSLDKAERQDEKDKIESKLSVTIKARESSR